MLWDENRQNKDMLLFYQTLIRLRHEYPVLTKGTVTEQFALDEKGVIGIKRQMDGQSIWLLFNGRNKTAEVPERKGLKNLLDGQCFSGSLGDYEAAVLVE